MYDLFVCPHCPKDRGTLVLNCEKVFAYSHSTDHANVPTPSIDLRHDRKQRFILSGSGEPASPCPHLIEGRFDVVLWVSAGPAKAGFTLSAFVSHQWLNVDAEERKDYETFFRQDATNVDSVYRAEGFVRLKQDLVLPSYSRFFTIGVRASLVYAEDPIPFVARVEQAAFEKWTRPEPLPRTRRRAERSRKAVAR